MKYIYSTNNNIVYCRTRFAGKTIKGIAKCDPADTFVLVEGKRLAKARCAAKVAKKRCKLAEQLIKERAVIRAQAELDLKNAFEKRAAALKEYADALTELEDVTTQLCRNDEI